MIRRLRRSDCNDKQHCGSCKGRGAVPPRGLQSPVLIGGGLRRAALSEVLHGNMRPHALLSSLPFGEKQHVLQTIHTNALHAYI